MTIRQTPQFPYSQVTPRQIWLNRRRFLGAGSSLAMGAFAAPARTQLEGVTKSPLSTDEKPTPYAAVTGYNNYYEFGTGKEDPARNAHKLRTSPWTVKIEGEVAKPKTLELDDLYKIAPLEERIYRHRC